MAEDYVSKDQFGEFVKRMEAGFHGQDQRTSDLRQSQDQRFTALERRHEDLRQDLRQGFADLRQEMRDLRSTTQRQLWVILGAVIAALVKTVFFP